MFSNFRVKNTTLIWEKLFAITGRRVIKPQGFTQISESISGDCPICNFEMNGFRAHIINVSRIIIPLILVKGTHELSGLKDDFTQVSHTDAGIFAHRGADAVDHDRGDCLHPVFAFAARFTLDEPGKGLSICQWHKHSPPLVKIVNPNKNIADYLHFVQ